MKREQPKFTVAQAREKLRAQGWILHSLTDRYSANPRKAYGYQAYPYVGTNDPEKGPVVTFRAGQHQTADDALLRLVEFIEKHRASTAIAGDMGSRAWRQGFEAGLREAKRRAREAKRKAKA